MNILFVNTVCGTGSTGRIVVEQYKKAELEGHTCMVAYGRGDSPREINGYRIGSDFDMYFHAFMTRITDKTAFYSKRATKIFINKVRTFAPDKIILHNLHGYYLDIEQLFIYIKEEKIPVEWTLHDCWAFTGHCSHFDFIDCNKWLTQCSKCPQKSEYPKSSIADNSIWNYKKKKELFTNVDELRIITPSDWLAQLVKKSFLGEYPIEVINNKVDKKIFRPVKSDFRKKYKLEDKIILLGVANVWTPRKGLNDFIELSGILNDKYKIVLIGVNDKNKKHLTDNMIGINRTESAQELAEIYSASDFYINLTYEDTYPTTNLEARACGTTVITYRTGGSVETADIVVEQGDLKKIIETVVSYKNL